MTNLSSGFSKRQTLGEASSFIGHLSNTAFTLLNIKKYLMERKTMTTLGELRIDDRFVYPKRADAWCVTARADRKGRVAINQKKDDGSLSHKYDDLKKASTPVLFLRHGSPLEGEECFISDLKAGDIFHKRDDVIHEYELKEKGHQFSKVRRLDEAAHIMAGNMATVVLVKRKEAK
jgi:hypothetical protein